MSKFQSLDRVKEYFWIFLKIINNTWGVVNTKHNPKFLYKSKSEFFFPWYAWFFSHPLHKSQFLETFGRSTWHVQKCNLLQAYIIIYIDLSILEWSIVWMDNFECFSHYCLKKLQHIAVEFKWYLVPKQNIEFLFSYFWLISCLVYINKINWMENDSSSLDTMIRN